MKGDRRHTCRGIPSEDGCQQPRGQASPGPFLTALTLLHCGGSLPASRAWTRFCCSGPQFVVLCCSSPSRLTQTLHWGPCPSGWPFPGATSQLIPQGTFASLCSGSWNPAGASSVPSENWGGKERERSFCPTDVDKPPAPETYRQEVILGHLFSASPQISPKNFLGLPTTPKNSQGGGGVFSVVTL